MIGHRPQGGFRAFQSDETDARVGYQLQDGVQHSQTGAQDRNEHDLTAQMRPSGSSKRRLNRNGDDAKGARRLVKHQGGYLTENAPEFLGASPLVAEPGEIMLHQRVRDDSDTFHL